MRERSEKNILAHLRKKWRYKALLSHFILALSLTIFAFTLLSALISLSVYWSIPCLLIFFIAIITLTPAWRLSEEDVAGYLNITQPALEESTHLLLKPSSALSLLEKLQAKKVSGRLPHLTLSPPFKRLFTTAITAFLLALGGSFIFLLISSPTKVANAIIKIKQASVINYLPESRLPEIKHSRITITPPSYTGKNSRQQAAFNVSAEEGATLCWQIQTNVPATEVKLLFNNGIIVELSGKAEKLTWEAKSLIKATGFYQVKINDKISEFYKMEVVKDQPPGIIVHAPGPSTLIAYGMAAKVIIKATLSDDYGLDAINISATISRGEGEAVKFNEQKLLTEKFPAGHKINQLQKLIDCTSLGMAPGDELYFFINATDNHQQQSRSDVYRITLQDTADLMTMEGMAMSLDIKPELFRSERQIIIETEQLLKDKTTLSVEDFRKKSNELGIDQKLLRLRYGKFLGEESDTETGTEEEHGVQDNHPGNTTDILKEYGHEHDNAEDATFFDAATKKQLKATLAEMWSAELKLRTFLPQEALPYEYKALRLLKDLQQKSRVYVQKTGIRALPVQSGKRLTGDLSKIDQPVKEEISEKVDSSTNKIRLGLSALEDLKTNGNLNSASQTALEQAFRQLSNKATGEPAAYLASLSALKKILDKRYTLNDIGRAEQGLQKMVENTKRLPYTSNKAIMTLSKEYFINLNKAGKQ